MTTTRDYAAITTIEAAKALAEKLLKDNLTIGFDVETGYSGEPFPKRSVDPSHKDQFIVGFSITNSKSWARYIPLRHDGYEHNLNPREVWEIFRPVLEGLDMVAHHKKFEDKNLKMLPLHGDADKPICTKVGHDSMLDAYVLGQWKEVGLKFLSETILGVKQMTLGELFEIELGKKLTANDMKKIRFNVLPVTQNVIDYACDDAALCLELHEFFGPLLEQEGPNPMLIHNLERYISYFMADMELEGVAVDWDLMELSAARHPKFSENYLKAVRNEFSYYTDTDMESLNFGSSTQMRKLLYTDMGLTVTRMTKSKDNPQPSTDATALAALSKENEAVKKLLKYREIGVMGTRHKKWLTETTHSWDKRAHASYNQTRVPTGRFSAADPAIQQLPKTWFWSVDDRVKYDKKMGLYNPENLVNGEDFWYGNFRDFIISAPGKYFLTYDVSQGELRVLAGVSQEKRLIEAFVNGEDVHTLTAAMMLGKEPEDVEDADRQIGKALPLDEGVLTPQGWVEMGSLKVGDVVTTPSGTAKIHGVYPQEGDREIYVVRTTDGGRTRADGEHLWETHRGLVTTEELQPKDALPTAVFRPEKPIACPMDPYTLGVLICAGTFGNPTLQMEIRTGDENILNLMKFPEGVTVSMTKDRRSKKIYTVSGGSEKSRKYSNSSTDGLWRNPLEAVLCELGLRTSYDARTQRRGGVAAEHKFIPAVVYHMSAFDRMMVLRGIMDARGILNNSRSAEVSFTSPRLAAGVQELVWGLGGRAAVSRTRRNGLGLKGRNVAKHTVILTTETTPFNNPYLSLKWQTYPVFRTIESITKEYKKAPTQCIALDDGIGLFVAGDYMVTHNTMNFALLYQMGEKSLSETLAISKDRASELYANYFKQFTSVTMWMDEARRNGKSKGYAETFLGRRMPLWGLDSPSRGVRGAAERASVNYPIQGGLADIVKIVMLRSYKALEEAGLWGNGVMMVMNQHDALTFEVDNSLDPVYVRGLLAEAANLKFKGFPNFVIDWEMGTRWGSSTPWNNEPVFQDENGNWHVDKGDTKVEQKVIAEKPKMTKTDTPVAPVLTEEKELHVATEQSPSRERLVEFFDLVKRNPGDTKVTLLAPGLTYVLPVKTSLSVNDSARISLALNGAIVRVPENSASLAAIAYDIELGEG